MKRLVALCALLLALCTLTLAVAPQRMLPGEMTDGVAAPARVLAGPEMRAVADVGVKKIIPRIPVIMVEFADFAFTRTNAQVDSMFNGVNYKEVYPQATAKGSIRQYFSDQSMGKYTPQFDIYGPVRVSKSCCANFAITSNVGSLVKEACALADSVVDFAQYDADGDGQIDLVYVYYAGFGRSDESYIADGLVPNKKQLIWPHWSTTYGASFDGKQIRDYECANELDGYWTKSLSEPYPAGMGVAVHEFCHALGLPDLYPTNGTSSSFRHLGAYDVMDYGGYNDELFCPPSLSAYERWFLGWLTPKVLNTPQTVELNYIGETNQAYLITADGIAPRGPHTSTNAYYLLENRQKKGWDNGQVLGSDLLGHGLMITRVEYSSAAWNANTVNNDPDNQRVWLIAADGDYGIDGDKWYGKATDLFPAGATSFTPFDDYPITNITEDADGVIRFLFMGGTSSRDAEAVAGQPVKRLQDGRLVIVKGDREYTLLGTRVR